MFFMLRFPEENEALSNFSLGLCEYSVPLGGMFLWMKVPEITSTWDMIMERGLAQNIMLMPGKLSILHLSLV